LKNTAKYSVLATFVENRFAESKKTVFFSLFAKYVHAQSFKTL